jgi:hypothetical protein
MAIKYIDIFHSKVLKNMPKSEFLVGKYTIWQPQNFKLKRLTYELTMINLLLRCLILTISTVSRVTG